MLEHADRHISLKLLPCLAQAGVALEAIEPVVLYKVDEAFDVGRHASLAEAGDMQQRLCQASGAQRLILRSCVCVGVCVWFQGRRGKRRRRDGIDTM